MFQGPLVARGVPSCHTPFVVSCRTNCPCAVICASQFAYGFARWNTSSPYHPLPHIIAFIEFIWIKLYIVSFISGDTSDYQKQLKQMIKDLAKEKDKGETELPKMSQVRTWDSIHRINHFAK